MQPVPRNLLPLPTATDQRALYAEMQDLAGDLDTRAAAFEPLASMGDTSAQMKRDLLRELALHVEEFLERCSARANT